MAEIVNLRQARKAKQRTEAAKQAEASRARHGETKGEKLRRKQAAERLSRGVEGAKIEKKEDSLTQSPEGTKT